MNIEGLDYNTQRQPLLLPEYGREIQKMVDYAISLPDRDERTLWDHLFLMSHNALDIDWPYDVSQAEHIHAKPEPMARPANSIRLRHYGRLVEELWDRLKQMPEGPERDQLACYTANQMKRDLVLWGHGSIDDEKVVSDLAEYTDGVIQLDLNSITLERFVPADELPVNNKKGKKKK